MSCSLWFTSELNAKDHIEGVHKFQEGHGTSFYECLLRHRMVREPDLLRDTSTDHPSYLDGPGIGAPIGSGVKELVHSY